MFDSMKIIIITIIMACPLDGSQQYFSLMNLICSNHHICLSYVPPIATFFDWEQDEATLSSILLFSCPVIARYSDFHDNIIIIIFNEIMRVRCRCFSNFRL